MSNKTMADIKTQIVNGREVIVDGYEGFYVDEDGYLQDADFHEEILAEGDDEGARLISVEVAKRNGLGDIADRWLGPVVLELYTEDYLKSHRILKDSE